MQGALYQYEAIVKRAHREADLAALGALRRAEGLALEAKQNLLKEACRKLANLHKETLDMEPVEGIKIIEETTEQTLTEKGCLAEFNQKPIPEAQLNPAHPSLPAYQGLAIKNLLDEVESPSRKRKLNEASI